MLDDIAVSVRKFRRHVRRSLKHLDNGHAVVLRRRGRQYLVQRLEQAEVDADLLERARAVLNPQGELNDRMLVDTALRNLVLEARNRALSVRSNDDRT
jgi:hypothetical protein